jgi:hypothetical protein
MPVGELLRRFTSPELTELMALYDLRARPEPPKQTMAEARALLDGMARKRKAP